MGLFGKIFRRKPKEESDGEDEELQRRVRKLV